MSTARTGYCTVADVRRVLQETEMDFDSGALGEDQNRIVVDAIAGLREWMETKTHRHWYVSGGLSSEDDPQGVIPTGPYSRDDEHDIPTSGGTVHGADEEPHRWGGNSDALLESGRRDRNWYQRDAEERGQPKERIRLAFGDQYNEDIPGYTRIRFDRKDVTAVNELLVANADGGFDDWTGADYSGGIGKANQGEDWWVRINNRGVAELHLDVHAMDDDLASLSNAVYVDFEYGTEELTPTVRRGVAHLAAADLIVDDEFTAGLPDNGQLVNVETKSERWERRGKEILSEHWVADPDEVTRAGGE